MSERHEDLRSERDEPGEGKVEEILASYIDRLNDGELVDPEEVLFDHPDCGEEVLAQLDAFLHSTTWDASDSNAPLGTLGDYALRRQVGRGGMGVVYQAWQGAVERQVALKILPVGIAADDRAFHRFMREARTAAKLSHPNVVHVYGMGVENHTPYYAMEYVEGDTLAQVLSRSREADVGEGTPFGEKESPGYFATIARIFAAVADGLQHAHSRGVVHRDIKPSNLIFDSEGRLRILDFGLAHLEGQEGLTLSGDVVGTPAYMSPEQARRKKVAVDQRTDVYSLGATLFEVLVGRPPFRGKDYHDTLSQIIECEPPGPRRLNPRLPRDLETVVLKCLAKHVPDRYASAAALAEDLRRFAEGQPVAARPPSPVKRTLRRVVRSRAVWSAVGVLLLAALAFAVYNIFAHRGTVTVEIWAAPPSVSFAGTISSDGRYVSYVDWDAGNIGVHDLVEGTGTLLTENTTWNETGGTGYRSTISQDGQWIAYNWLRAGPNGFYELRVVDRTGANSRVLLSDSDTFWIDPFDWAADGSDVLASLWDARRNQGKLARIAFADGAIDVLWEWGERSSLGKARRSPDGRFVAFDFEVEGVSPHHDISLVSGDGDAIPLVRHPSDDRLLGWTPEGGLLFVSDRTFRPTLWLLDLADGRPSGEARCLDHGRTFEGSPVGVAADGSFFYAVQTTASDVSVRDFESSTRTLLGDPSKVTARFEAANCMAEWSPDGESLAYRVGRGGSRASPFGPGDWDFVVYSLPTGDEHLLRPWPAFRDGTRVDGPSWSPDGNSLVVSAHRLVDGPGIYSIQIESGQTTSLVREGHGEKLRSPRWSPDARFLYFLRESRASGRTTVVRREIATGDELELLAASPLRSLLDISSSGEHLALVQLSGAILLVATDGRSEPEIVYQGEQGVSRPLAWLQVPGEDDDLLFGQPKGELWHLDVEGRTASRVAQIDGLEHADVHPSGRRVALTVTHYGQRLEVLRDFLSGQ